MSLPTIVLFTNLDRVVVLLGPGTDDWDADDYSTIKLVCPGLSLDKTGASEASGANVSFEILQADVTGKTATTYEYQLVGTSGAYEVDLGTGIIDLRESVS